MSNRTKFAEAIAQSLNISKKEGDAILVAVTGALKTHLAVDGEAIFPGLGRLKLSNKPARKGRNPKTGESIDIPAKVAAKFKLFPKNFE